MRVLVFKYIYGMIATALLLYGTPLQLLAQPTFSESAGFIRHRIQPGESTFVSQPFISFGDINVSCADQLQGDGADGSDAVVFWDIESQQYVQFFKSDKAQGFVNERGQVTGVVWDQGEGIFITNNDRRRKHLYVFGVVGEQATSEQQLVTGLNAFGYPYPASIALADTGLANAIQAGISDAPDIVIEDPSGATHQLSIDAEDHLVWLDEQGNPSELVLKMGQGYWYRTGAELLDWVAPRPWEATTGSVGGPVIISIESVPERMAMRLRIQTTGRAGETLSIYCQDQSLDGAYAPQNEWRLAADGIPADGNVIEWIDTGAKKGLRSVIESEARFYVVVSHGGASGRSGEEEAITAALGVIATSIENVLAEDSGSQGADRQGRRSIIYVDKTAGDDTFDGADRSFKGQLKGPKRSIRSGLDGLLSDGTLVVKGGEYDVSSFDFLGRSLHIKPEGAVVLKTQTGEER